MSPTGPNFGFSDYGVCEYDPQVDFTQVLEEARQAQEATSWNIPSLLQQPEEAEKRGTGQFEKVKKSWKSSLLNWWKPDRKVRPRCDPLRGSCLVNQPKGQVSGPNNGHGRSGVYVRRASPASGPLATLFNAAKKEESEMPYMCLNRVNSCPGVRTYGPVYLVT